jgi:hypothetical protein
MDLPTTRGKKAYSIELSCGAAADYSNCNPRALRLGWGQKTTGSVRASITVRGATGCEGDKRPVLSANDPTGDPYFEGDRTILFIQERDPGNTAGVGSKLDFTLLNLVLDGYFRQTCIFINSPSGYISHTQRNVDVKRCNYPLDPTTGIFGILGAGMTFFGGRTSIVGGDIYQNQGDAEGGGAGLSWFSGTSKGSLTVSGVNFTQNSGGTYGAVYLDQRERVRKVTFRNCLFSGNTAPLGSAIHYLSSTTTNPPKKFTIALPGSKFIGVLLVRDYKHICMLLPLSGCAS